MDVRCPQCGTDYVFDERRIGSRGVSVKCTACTHVFRVYRPERRDPWLVRKADGSQVEFAELTVLQKWIVQGRIDRSAHISRGGNTWKPLGDIAELEPFFEVYDKARQLQDLLAARGQEHQPRPATDVIEAMDPIDETFMDSSGEILVPTIPARPVTLSERRHHRSTDLVVVPAGATEATTEPDTKPMIPARPAFASRNLEFREEEAPVRARRSPPRAASSWRNAAVILLLLGLAATTTFVVRFPEQVRELAGKVGVDLPEDWGRATAETNRSR